MYSRAEQGQGIVEFVVIFPILITLFFVIIDGGLLMGRYNSISNATKEGARLGAVAANQAEIVSRVKENSHGYLDDASTDCGDWSDDSVPDVICVEWISGSDGAAPGQIGAAVRVRVRYEYDFVTPITNRFGVGSWDVTACAIQRQEQSISPVPNPQSGVESCDD